jgi:hypothetical protein
MPHSGFLVSSEPPGGCFCAAGSSPVSQRAGGWPLGWQQQQRGGEAGGPQGTGAPSAGNEVTRSPHLRAQVSGGPARPGSPCARPWAPPRVGGRPPYPGGDGAGRLRGRTDGRTDGDTLRAARARRGEARRGEGGAGESRALPDRAGDGRRPRAMAEARDVRPCPARPCAPPRPRPAPFKTGVSRSHSGVALAPPPPARFPLGARWGLSLQNLGLAASRAWPRGCPGFSAALDSRVHPRPGVRVHRAVVFLNC